MNVSVSATSAASKLGRLFPFAASALRRVFGGNPEEPMTLRRFFRRRPWINGATTLIIAGTLMLLQPFSMALYSYSFTVVVAGTVGYLIVSHFPE